MVDINWNKPGINIYVYLVQYLCWRPKPMHNLIKGTAFYASPNTQGSTIQSEEVLRKATYS